MTPDEAQVLSLLAGAQSSHWVLFDAHLCWVAQKGPRAVVAAAALLLAETLSENGVRIAESLQIEMPAVILHGIQTTRPYERSKFDQTNKRAVGDLTALACSRLLRFHQNLNTPNATPPGQMFGASIQLSRRLQKLFGVLGLCGFSRVQPKCLRQVSHMPDVIDRLSHEAITTTTVARCHLCAATRDRGKQVVKPR